MATSPALYRKLPYDTLADFTPIAGLCTYTAVFTAGPGLPADQRDAALERGARLDETTPGSGLGLSIVVELTRAYGGSITLADSDLGGLKVLLELPAAEA